ncbi:MAG: DUF2478 domain-containing protein [Devosiaceae bacterium]
MKIAYTMMPGRGDMDRLLAALADDLLVAGYCVRGVVQSNQERPGDHPCDMDIKVLPAGAELRISQALGKGSRGCRLDPSILQKAALSVERSLATGADLLLINKYGKNEAQGRGFYDAIAQAVAMDVPVLCGLNSLNFEAFMSFTDRQAFELKPDIGSLKTWVVGAVTAQTMASDQAAFFG